MQSFDELLTLLKGTRYEAIVMKYKASSAEEINYIGLEHELRVNYYDTVMEVVSAYKGAGEGMRQIVLARIELDNIALIYRLKKYFKVPAAGIKAMVTHRYCLFTPKQIEALIDECTAEEIPAQALCAGYSLYDHRAIYKPASVPDEPAVYGDLHAAADGSVQLSDLVASGNSERD